MFRFTIALLLLACGLTGYRLIGQIAPIAEILPPALAQPAIDMPGAATDTLDTSGATPTVAPLFLAQTPSAATPTPTVDQSLMIERPPTPQPSNRTTTATVQHAAPTYPEVVIYDDHLNTNWSIEQSTKTEVNLAETNLRFQPLDTQQERSSGAATIAVSPQADYGTIFFTVRPESGASYKRQAVLGVSLWLNSGSAGIATDALAIAVLGSNAFPYWTPDDQSVFPDKSGSFSETRLYFLKINRTIPPNTWLNLVVWLNDLQYDPVYEYVTGFYLKNDADFHSTYYLDQVALLMAP